MPSLLIGKDKLGAENPCYLLDYLLEVSKAGRSSYVLVYKRIGNEEEIHAFAASSKKSLDNHFECDVESLVELLEKDIKPIRLYKNISIESFKDYPKETVI